MLPDTYYESRSFIKGQNMYLWVDSDVLDFTAQKKYTLNVSTTTHLASFPFGQDNTREFFSFFNDLSNSNPIVFAWDYKNLNSYFLNKTKRTLDFINVYDIKIIESFHGISLDKPKDFEEAKKRLASIPNFSKLKKIWQEIYYPLVTTVIPSIENTPVVDKVKKKHVFPYYQIEGQVNGRMKCSSAYSCGYNPHAMTPATKEALGPAEYEDSFVYFDFKSMEVLVLQWLSKDVNLGKIINNNDDVYCKIWEKITGIPCDDHKRKLCKELFLPVIFGQGYKTTAENLKISENSAKKIIDNIYNSFPDALGYVNQKTSNGQICDFFGRIRRFEEQTFKVRNFLIQSPASTICLHKLVNLYKKIKNIARICYHLHDGFCILVNKQNLKQAITLGKEALEEQSEFYPGLNLKVDVKVGNKLFF